MWHDDALEEHLKTSRTIQGDSAVIAEWNMNNPSNVARIGNYRHRISPTAIGRWTTYDPIDSAGQYTGGTDSTISTTGDYEYDPTEPDPTEPTIFLTKSEKQELLYSLDDCIKPHRPRSGINYLSYFSGRFIGGDNVSSERPRWYMNSYKTPFKYWTSFREEDGETYGVAKPIENDRHFIDDVSPFVVYKESVPTNKLVVKVQTGVGEIDIGEINTETGTIPDPLFGFDNSMVPRTWKIEVLRGTTWNTAMNFNEEDVRKDGTPIVGSDGYVELTFGLVVPEEYGDHRYRGNLKSEDDLPSNPLDGDYYYVVAGDEELGTVSIWSNDKWNVFIPEYDWSLQQDYNDIDFGVTDLTNPISFSGGSRDVFREFEYIDGIRVSVDTMNNKDDTFDLIEMSPRLVANLTDRIVDFKTTKTLGKIDSTKVPVGDLSVGVGSISIFDEDDAFKDTNTNSIIHKYLDHNISFYFYEIVRNVSGYDYRIPIKKMYTEGKEPKQSSDHKVSYELRDLFYLLESISAPEMLLTDVSLSYVVTTLLDSAGFGNYVFKRADNASEPIIPYFFIPPDKNIAEILKSVAIASQSAMFFDEYNNFVVMYKEHLLPSDEFPRETDMILDGDSSVPNIKAIASQEKGSYNKGKINYTERYIQRTKGSMSQAAFTDWDTQWYYTPALLWEAVGDNMTKTINEAVTKESQYSMAAMPLSNNLSDSPPSVRNRIVINNVMDFGENVIWLSRYSGYFYSSAEIIRFDAVQYSVQGTGSVWVDSNDEYQYYASTLPWNGKMFPTGLVRIFTEPLYEIVDGISMMKNGELKSHGRGQFHTDITSHSAGIPSYWSDIDNATGMRMKAEYLFDTSLPAGTEIVSEPSGTSSKYFSSSRNGLIKNWLRDIKYTDADIRSFKTPRAGVVQSSALVFSGPPLVGDRDIRDNLSVVHKQLPSPYVHWGTRMRIIGELVANSSVDQEPTGGDSIYGFSGFGLDQELIGGCGGITIGFNASKNTGYFFEIIALSNSNLDELSQDYEGAAPHNIIFYKVGKDQADSESDKATPVKLWGGTADIIVDDGTFVGQSRISGEESSSVYDISVEYKKISSTHSRFFLYMNGNQIATVNDYKSLKFYDRVGLFVRGRSQVMFENLFALGTNVAEDRSKNVISSGMSNRFGGTELDVAQAGKYAISGVVQESYLKGINPDSGNDYNMYYEEFGSIMREASYFDVKYDKAYPALLAKISPTFNGERAYTVSGFFAGSYSAQFLVFNATDKTISLDETTGNYLRIQGVAFTQNAARELSMDDYFKDIGNLSGSAIRPVGNTVSAQELQDQYLDLKINRMRQGDKEFTLTSEYIQTQDFAAGLMKWLIDKTTRPRKQIGIELFSTPTLQLGDLVNIQYSRKGIDLVTSPDTKFLVYNMTFEKTSTGPKTTVYLSET